MDKRVYGSVMNTNTAATTVLGTAWALVTDHHVLLVTGYGDAALREAVAAWRPFLSSADLAYTTSTLRDTVSFATMVA